MQTSLGGLLAQPGPPGGAEGNLVKFPLFGMICKSSVSLEVVKIGRRLLRSKLWEHYVTKIGSTHVGKGGVGSWGYILVSLIPEWLSKSAQAVCSESCLYGF
jgi:hypothetical protein